MRKIIALLVVIVAMTGRAAGGGHPHTTSEEMSTFSIVAMDPETGDFGVAVQSKFFNAAAIVPWARAELGAIATQARANYQYGPKGLRMLEQGMPAEEVVKWLIEEDPDRDFRQVAVIDRNGNVAQFTGTHPGDYKGHLKRSHFGVQGNILAGPEVLEEMARAFEQTQGELADRLIAALYAGQAAGGDNRGMQSAGLYIVGKRGGFFGTSDVILDLRADDNPEPIKALETLLLHSRINGQMSHALALAGEKKFQDAIAEVNVALEKDPNYWDTHYRAARIYFMAGQNADAKHHLERAFRLNSTLREIIKRDPGFEPFRGEIPAARKR